MCAPVRSKPIDQIVDGWAMWLGYAVGVSCVCSVYVPEPITGAIQTTGLDPFETSAKWHSIILRLTRRPSEPHRHCAYRARRDSRQYFNETANGRRYVTLFAVYHPYRPHPVKLLDRKSLQRDLPRTKTFGLPPPTCTEAGPSLPLPPALATASETPVRRTAAPNHCLETLR